MGICEKPNNLCLSIITCLNTFKQAIMKLLRDKNVFHVSFRNEAYDIFESAIHV